MTISNLTTGIFMASRRASNSEFGIMTSMNKRIRLIDMADQIAAAYEQHVNKTGHRDPDLYEKMLTPIHELDKELHVNIIMNELMTLINNARKEDAWKRYKEKVKRSMPTW